MFLISIVLVNVFLYLLLKLYCVLTCGINKCSRHLVGKVVVITGGSSGIGYETAKDLAGRGARVIIGDCHEGLGTNARDAIIAATGNKDVHHRNLDLASFASVRKFAEDIIKMEKQLDILINNAGVIETSNTTSEDGLSVGMQTNHFGPFLLTNLLLPLLKSSAPSRIINVSSMAYRYGNIDFENFEKVKDDAFGSFNLYYTTKLCTVLMTIELERLLRGTGVTANCLHPGTVATSIYVPKKWIKKLLCFLTFLNKTPWEGAQTSIYLAVAPELQDVSGLYFSDCHVSKYNSKAEDPELAKKVWKRSERVVDLK